MAHLLPLDCSGPLHRSTQPRPPHMTSTFHRIAGPSVTAFIAVSSRSGYRSNTLNWIVTMMFYRALLAIAVLAAATFIGSWSTPTANAAVILIVNTTDDVDTGVCNPAHCSLREAIAEANLL